MLGELVAVPMLGKLIAFSVKPASAQTVPQTVPQIVPDNTLPNNSRVTTQGNTTNIEGGTNQGGNLFHSFEHFSVPGGVTAHFQNAANIQSIITRVTGNSISKIDGILRANGTADLFLINPNGIIFGRNASLNIGGSFIGSTASSVNFADGTKFSATKPQTKSLLTISAPTGLQFGSTAGPIRNQSQASPDGAINIFKQPVGLQVPTGKTLALVGGDVTLEGGSLTASEGRIELGSVAENSLVSLSPTDKGWVLGYDGVQKFQNIQLMPLNTDDSLTPFNAVDTSGEGGGDIQLQGNLVELNGFLVLTNQTIGDRDAGELTINANKLSIKDGAQVLTVTRSKGRGGNLIVNASESVELIGRFIPAQGRALSSTLSSSAGAEGNAGDITINTPKLSLQDGASISAESGGIFAEDRSQFIPASGSGGNLTVNASESVEIIGTAADGFPSKLTASAGGSGDAGKLTIATKNFVVRDGAQVSVNSQIPERENFTYLGDIRDLGKAGELNIIADSVFLDNGGKLISDAQSGDGGDISLQVRDFLIMRRNSQISTNAGTAQLGGDGGNITIDAPNGFIVTNSLENNDITANAFEGSGGKVQIQAVDLFGIEPRSRANLVEELTTNDLTKLDPFRLPTSDITAISQKNPDLNGEVIINSPDRESYVKLFEAPTAALEIKVSSVCRAPFARGENSFIITGRGGFPENPREVLRGTSINADWINLPPSKKADREKVKKPQHTKQKDKAKRLQKNQSTDIPERIVEARGSYINKDGDVVLTANPELASSHNFMSTRGKLDCE